MAQRKNTPVERYLEHLFEIFKVEPEFFPMEQVQPNLVPVTALVYRDVPEPGFVTGITYGLSLGEHPDWKHGRPELCITVETGEIAWAQAAAYIANGMRGTCPFSYGSSINFGEPVHEQSKMSAFFVFAPSILERDQYADIEIGAPYKINIVGLYPIYHSEIEVLAQMGLKDFWHHEGFDPFDVRRAAITG